MQIRKGPIVQSEFADSRAFGDRFEIKILIVTKKVRNLTEKQISCFFLLYLPNDSKIKKSEEREYGWREKNIVGE